MKACPFCQAEIEENARFCLYCMTSLDQKQIVPPLAGKKRRWPYIAVAALVLLLLAGGVWLALSGKPAASPAETGEKSHTTGRQTTAGTTTTAATTTTQAAAIPTESTTTTTAATSSGSTGQSAGGTQATETTGSQTTSGTKTPTGTGTSATTTTTKEAVSTTSSTKATSSTGATTTTTAPPAKTVTYTYRQATNGDDFSVHAVFDDTDIVITGVSQPAENGIYVIPETIDGKRVVAIMGGAFSDSGVAETVKAVTIPATVKTVWNYAFSGCDNLTDLYLQGTAVYIEAKAFAPVEERSGILTIHCAATCSDRNFRYYKDAATSYGAVYEEWEG